MENSRGFNWKDCVGPGWGPLVQRLIDAADAEDAKIFDVKEKWGGLRVFVAGSEALQNLADELEDESFRICEECGKPGECKSQYGWFRTLCDDCREAKNE